MSIHHPGVLPSSDGVDDDGNTSGMAGDNGSYTPELFSTPPTPDVQPETATPTDVPMRIDVTPTDAGLVTATVVSPSVATPCKSSSDSSVPVSESLSSTRKVLSTVT